MNGEAEQGLRRGLEQIDFVCGEQAYHGLLRYMELLAKWNRAYNLTSVREPIEIVRRHILDCLVILPYVHGRQLLDIGTGAGLPGMILAIARPDLKCMLLDGNGKKTRFCIQAVTELALSNVEVMRARVEEYVPRRLFDTVTARAFAGLSVLWDYAEPLVAPGGRLLAMKGTKKEAIQEVEGVDIRRGKSRIVALTVPGLASERHLVVVERVSAPSSNSPFFL